MKIIFDDAKRLANLAKHGLDFASLDVEFFFGATIRPAKLGRFSAIGRHSGALISVIFAPLGTEAVAVISMRPASKEERKLL